MHWFNYDVFTSKEIDLTLTNCADTDEMPHMAAFHLGLHCLQKYTFRRIQHTKWIFGGINGDNYCCLKRPLSNF